MTTTDEASELLRVFARVERSDAFARAPALRRVLRYLVDAELQSATTKLTPYRVAVEAFGKPADFDPASSASVRVEMARLRRVLREDRAQHPEDPGIDIPSGSYRPRVVLPAPRGARHGVAANAAAASGPGVMVVGFESELDAADAHVAVGFARMLYERLAAWRWLYVVDGLDLTPDTPELFELCAGRYECQFLVRGRIRALAAGGYAVRVELMDAVQRNLAWSDDYTLTLAELEARQDAITTAVAHALGQPLGVITQVGLGAQRGVPTDPRWRVADLVMRYHHYSTLNPTAEENARLEALAERIVADMPESAPAWATLGALQRDRFREWGVPYGRREAQLAAAARSLERALQLDPLLIRSTYFLAGVRYMQGNLAAFRGAATLAMTLNAHVPDMMLGLGAMLCCAGDVDAGMDLVERSALRAHHLPYYRVRVAYADYAAGRVDSAAAVVRTLPADATSVVVQMVRAYVLAETGEHGAARAALDTAYAHAPMLRQHLRAEVDTAFLDGTLRERAWNALVPLLAAGS